jgi:tryptophan synthase alpha chain
MSRIGRRFQQLRETGERALIAYVTAGDPTPDRTPAIVWALERGGADIVELGVPFSDPVADGPRIQLAMDRALAAGTTLVRVLDIARQIRAKSEIPPVLFSYLNPLLRYGFDRLARDAVEAGIDGCLITDLSVEEADSWVHKLNAAGLDTVFLAAPTSTGRRLELVSRYSNGFVYIVSRTGVTGDQQSGDVASMAESLRKLTSTPLAVGFGISTPEDARAQARQADAVVVGSAIVKVVEESGGGDDLEPRLEAFARSLKAPLRGGRG